MPSSRLCLLACGLLLGAASSGTLAAARLVFSAATHHQDRHFVPPQLCDHFNFTSGVNNSLWVLQHEMQNLAASLPPVNATGVGSNWTDFNQTDELYYHQVPMTSAAFTQALRDTLEKLATAYPLLKAVHANASAATKFYPKHIPNKTYIATGEFINKTLSKAQDIIGAALTPLDKVDNATLKTAKDAIAVADEWSYMARHLKHRVHYWTHNISANNTGEQNATARHKLNETMEHWTMLNATEMANSPFINTIYQIFASALLPLETVRNNVEVSTVYADTFLLSNWEKATTGAAFIQKIRAILVKVSMETDLDYVDGLLTQLCGAV